MCPGSYRAAVMIYLCVMMRLTKALAMKHEPLIFDREKSIHQEIGMQNSIIKETPQMMVNKHAVVQVHVTIHSPYPISFREDSNYLLSSPEGRWIVILDELLASHEDEQHIHLEQVVTLQWKNRTLGNSDLSFIVPLHPTISRTFILSLLRVSAGGKSRLLTRRLANAHAINTMVSDKGSPVVTVELRGILRGYMMNSVVMSFQRSHWCRNTCALLAIIFSIIKCCGSLWHFCDTEHQTPVESGGDTESESLVQEDDNTSDEEFELADEISNESCSSWESGDQESPSSECIEERGHASNSVTSPPAIIRYHANFPPFSKFFGEDQLHAFSSLPAHRTYHQVSSNHGKATEVATPIHTGKNLETRQKTLQRCAIATLMNHSAITTPYANMVSSERKKNANPSSLDKRQNMPRYPAKSLHSCTTPSKKTANIGQPICQLSNSAQRTTFDDKLQEICATTLVRETPILRSRGMKEREKMSPKEEASVDSMVENSHSRNQGNAELGAREIDINSKLPNDEYVNDVVGEMNHGDSSEACELHENAGEYSTRLLMSLRKESAPRSVKLPLVDDTTIWEISSDLKNTWDSKVDDGSFTEEKVPTISSAQKCYLDRVSTKKYISLEMMSQGQLMTSAKSVVDDMLQLEDSRAPDNSNLANQRIVARPQTDDQKVKSIKEPKHSNMGENLDISCLISNEREAPVRNLISELNAASVPDSLRIQSAEINNVRDDNDTINSNRNDKEKHQRIVARPQTDDQKVKSIKESKHSNVGGNLDISCLISNQREAPVKNLISELNAASVPDSLCIQSAEINNVRDDNDAISSNRNDKEKQKIVSLTTDSKITDSKYPTSISGIGNIDVAGVEVGASRISDSLQNYGMKHEKSISSFAVEQKKVMALRSKLHVYQLPTPPSSYVLQSRCDQIWLPLLKSRTILNTNSLMAKNCCGKTTAESNSGSSSYVSTLEPDSEASSTLADCGLHGRPTRDPFEFKVCIKEVKGNAKKSLQSSNRNLKRKLDQKDFRSSLYCGGKAGRRTIKVPHESTVSIPTRYRSLESTDVIMSRKKRRYGTSFAIPDTISSLQILAQTINEPAWQYNKQNQSSSKAREQKRNFQIFSPRKSKDEIDQCTAPESIEIPPTRRSTRS